MDIQIIVFTVLVYVSGFLGYVSEQEFEVLTAVSTKNTILCVQSKVKVTLQQTASQSVCLDVESTNFNLTLEGYIKAKFLMLALGELHVKYVAQHGI
jgi:hypothetical protein